MPKCQASGTNPRECDQDFTRLTHLHRWLHCSVCLLHCIWGCSPCQDNNSAKKTETHSSDRCQISQQNRLLSDNFYYRDYNAILEHTRCHVCPSDENHKEKRKKERKRKNVKHSLYRPFTGTEGSRQFRLTDFMTIGT